MSERTVLKIIYNNLQSLKIQKYLRTIKRFYLLKKKEAFFERPLGNSGNLKVPLIDRDVQPEVLTPMVPLSMCFLQGIEEAT